MKNIIALITAVTLAFVVFGCSKKDPSPVESPIPTASPTSTPTPTESEAVPDSDVIHEISSSIYTETFNIDDNLVFFATAVYPKTENQAIDDYYASAYEDFDARARGLAEDYKEYDSRDSLVTEYQYSDDYQIIKNSDDIFSIHRTVFTYAGGPHGSHVDIGDNFRISDGKRLTLDDIFVEDEAIYTETILAVFEEHIQKDRAEGDASAFFENAPLILLDNFPTGSFCIDDEGLIFYFSPYFITPYSSGTVTIPVPWDSLDLTLKI